MTQITDVDWSVLDLPGVDNHLRIAAAWIARVRPQATTYDDAYQEARLYAATHPARVRTYVERGELPYLRRHICGRLLDKTLTEAGRQSRIVSWEALRAAEAA